MADSLRIWFYSGIGVAGLALAFTAGLRALPLHGQTDEAWGLASDQRPADDEAPALDADETPKATAPSAAKSDGVEKSKATEAPETGATEAPAAKGAAAEEATLHEKTTVKNSA